MGAGDFRFAIRSSRVSVGYLGCRRHRWSCHELGSRELSQPSCVQIFPVDAGVCGSGILSVPGNVSSF
jgi:hypothetical protein